MKNLSILVYLFCAVIILSCSKEEVFKEAEVGEKFEGKKSFDYYRNVVDSVNIEFVDGVKVNFKKIKSKYLNIKINFKYANISKPGGLQYSYKSDVKSGFILNGLDQGDTYLFGFSDADAKFPNWTVWHFKIEPPSNENIHGVEFKMVGTGVGIYYKSQISKEVKMRYRKKGFSKWTEYSKYIKDSLKLGGLNYGIYEFQFSYKDENWSNWNYNKWTCDLTSNEGIYDVELKKIEASIRGQRVNQRVKIYYKSKITKYITMRYREKGDKSWTGYNKYINQGQRYKKNGQLVLSGWNFGKTYEFQFTYKGERWTDDTKKYILYKHASNDSIYNVEFSRRGKSKIEVSFESSSAKKIDLRYRNKGEISGVSSNWINKYDVKNGIYIDFSSLDISKGGICEVQFSYEGEWWSWEGYKSYDFINESNANTNISDVNASAVFDGPKARINFNNKLSTKRVDARYRKKGSNSWINKHDVNSGFILDGIKGNTYEIQFSYEGEWWSWGGYDTHELDFILSDTGITNVRVEPIDSPFNSGFAGNGHYYATIKFSTKYNKVIDIRYRKKGSSSWREKRLSQETGDNRRRKFNKSFQVKIDYELDSYGQNKPGSIYEVQFSYYYEKWYWGGYKTYYLSL